MRVRHQIAIGLFTSVAAAVAFVILVGGSVVADPLAPTRRVGRVAAVVDPPLPSTTERACPVAGRPPRLVCVRPTATAPITS